MFPETDTPPPKPRLEPRTRFQGGFIMDRDTAIAWASRIANEQLTMKDICWVWQLIEGKVKPFGSRFSFVGEERFTEFMVVTRRAVFRKGYLGMDPAKIPQFREGARERIARKLLEEEGLGHLEFSTCLDSSPY
ncbi:uncharacterized protein EV420DRAFT_1524819 [Desarmillaria tabescens]|uniref:Uncharacterized protein n=1 Tax=Armillaria tabescens TaxID=1929756 RepID=A0AA39NBD8_ARMTA|nr:uncharacterized protein EV420DRAFT_1524819 [Desarmillaria tabescens]KAK0462439.1 hypothetical protein EV420DRAFT_1524819 [Desarmillaria tabescens]